MPPHISATTPSSIMCTSKSSVWVSSTTTERDAFVLVEEFEHVKLKVYVLTVSNWIDSLPFTFFDPLQSPPAEHEFVFEEVHSKVIDSFKFIVEDEDVNEFITGDGASWTSTDTEDTALLVPVAPEQVKVKL